MFGRKKTKTPIADRARSYALQCHQATNHFYDDKPYSYHLVMVVETAERFFDDQYSEADRDLIRADCWTHDVIEDCRQTYNDVKEELGEAVAEMAYALTNEKGRNRTERANDKYYAGIRAVPHATFVKLCDRIANVTYSKQFGSKSMFKKYRKENPDFLAKLQPGEALSPLVNYLEELLS